MHTDALKQLFTPFSDVDVTISNQDMYQMSSIKRACSEHYHAHSHGVYDHGHHHHENAHAPMDELTAED